MPADLQRENLAARDRTMREQARFEVFVEDQFNLTSIQSPLESVTKKQSTQEGAESGLIYAPCVAITFAQCESNRDVRKYAAEQGGWCRRALEGWRKNHAEFVEKGAQVYTPAD